MFYVIVVSLPTQHSPHTHCTPTSLPIPPTARVSTWPPLTLDQIVSSAQTGTGKTAAYALPLLHNLHILLQRERAMGTVKSQWFLALSHCLCSGAGHYWREGERTPGAHPLSLSRAGGASGEQHLLTWHPSSLSEHHGTLWCPQRPHSSGTLTVIY